MRVRLVHILHNLLLEKVAHCEVEEGRRVVNAGCTLLGALFPHHELRLNVVRTAHNGRLWLVEVTRIDIRDK